MQAGQRMTIARQIVQTSADSRAEQLSTRTDAGQINVHTFEPVCMCIAPTCIAKWNNGLYVKSRRDADTGSCALSHRHS